MTNIQLFEGVCHVAGGMENMAYWERLSHLKLMSLQWKGTLYYSYDVEDSQQCCTQLL